MSRISLSRYPEELKMYLSQDLQKRYHQLKTGDMFEIR
jgi:hypothetical protein